MHYIKKNQRINWIIISLIFFYYIIIFSKIASGNLSALLIIAVILPILLYIVLSHFYILFYLFIFIMPLESVLRIEGQETVLLNLMKPLGILLFFGWLLNIIIRKGEIKEVKEIILPFLFAIIGISSTLWSYFTPEAAFRIGIRILMDVSLFFLLYQCLNSSQKIWNSYKTYTFGTVISSAATLFEFIKNPHQRIAFNNVNEGVYPITLILGLFFLIYMALNAKSKYQKLLSILLSTAVYLAALASGTRSFIFPSLILIPLFIGKNVTIKGLIPENLKLSMLRITKVIFILTGFVTLFFMFFQNVEIIQERFNMGFEGESFNIRLFAIKNTYLALEYNPFLGVGLGNYAHFLESKTGIFIEAHNIYITSLQELGLIGFVVFIAFYLRILKKAIKLHSSLDGTNKYMLPAIYSFFMVSIFSLAEPTLQHKHIWFIFALLVSLYTIQFKQRLSIPIFGSEN